MFVLHVTDSDTRNGLEDAVVSIALTSPDPLSNAAWDFGESRMIELVNDDVLAFAGEEGTFFAPDMAWRERARESLGPDSQEKTHTHKELFDAVVEDRL